jgi:hypothetical protein
MVKDSLQFIKARLGIYPGEVAIISEPFSREKKEIA